jgi:uncharacterized protein DUF4276
MKRFPKSKKHKHKAIGIIAEDDSDVAVIRELIGKITKTRYRVEEFAGGGSGKIVGKCFAWAQNLRDKGCTYLILVHDLDQARITDLRATLVAALNESPIRIHIIVIPVREIEAWLLADHEAITKVMKLKRPLGQVSNPEAIQNPKEYLERLVYTKSEHTRKYVNAIHNEQIAAACTASNLRRCQLFLPLQQFISEHI